MKVICNRAELERGLVVASSAVTTRTPKPVLQCVRMSATADRLELHATDLEVSVRYELGQVDIRDAGDALVPADRVKQIVSSSRDETVSLETDGTKLMIRSEDATFEIYGPESSDFPSIADFSDEPGMVLPAGAVRDLIRKVEYAAARENTRYAINGVRWEFGGGQVRLVATDGRRLAKSWSAIDTGVSDAVEGAIIPLRALAQLRNLLNDPEEEVKVRLTNSQGIFQTRRAVVATQLVEGAFPRYEDVIPKDNDRKVEFVTQELLSAVKRAALLANEESRGVRLSFAKGLLTITSSVPESGRAEIRLSCNFDGAPLSIGFNPDYLLDALKVADTDTVMLELKNADRPGLLRAGQGFVYVIMPVNLD